MDSEGMKISGQQVEEELTLFHYLIPKSSVLKCRLGE